MNYSLVVEMWRKFTEGIRDCRVFARYTKEAEQLLSLDEKLNRQANSREYDAAIKTAQQSLVHVKKLHVLAKDVHKSRKAFYAVMLTIQKNYEIK